MKAEDRCIGPAVDKHGNPARCPREARAMGMCMSHYKQFLRSPDPFADPKDVLKPLRLERGTRLPGVVVSQGCGDALAKKGPSVYEATREVLEAWARGDR